MKSLLAVCLSMAALAALSPVQAAELFTDTVRADWCTTDGAVPTSVTG